VPKMYKNALWKNLAMTTDLEKTMDNALTNLKEVADSIAKKDPDYDPFDYNPREHDLWLAINALRFIVSQNYMPEHEWRLKEVAALLEMHLEQ
jgi:hypothetical protein